MDIKHTPVLLNKIYKEIFKPTDNLILDATVGEGGYSAFFLEKGVKKVIGLEQDKEILTRALSRLKPYGKAFTGYNLNFAEASEIFEKYYGKIDLALYDLGISMYHYKQSKRGFSYTSNEAPDMRLNLNNKLTATFVINNYSAGRLADIIYQYGGERKSRQIAAAIVKERSRSPITSAQRLAELTKPFYPPAPPIHPATRTFQALRIFVNRELDSLRRSLPAAIKALAPGGRIAVVAYHSLEDAIVKNSFRSFIPEKKNINKYRESSSKGKYYLLCKKPLRPAAQEVAANPSSRSAKLRALARI